MRFDQTISQHITKDCMIFIGVCQECYVIPELDLLEEDSHDEKCIDARTKSKCDCCIMEDGLEGIFQAMQVRNKDRSSKLHFTVIEH